jgi:hypothetical protein
MLIIRQRGVQFMLTNLQPRHASNQRDRKCEHQPSYEG